MYYCAPLLSMQWRAVPLETMESSAILQHLIVDEGQQIPLLIIKDTAMILKHHGSSCNIFSKKSLNNSCQII